MLEGYNLWFTIEIISFYSYIGAAILFIFESTVTSNLGIKEKDQHAYKHDFITYYNDELNWMSIIFMMFMCNGSIKYLNWKRID